MVVDTTLGNGVRHWTSSTVSFSAGRKPGIGLTSDEGVAVLPLHEIEAPNSLVKILPPGTMET